MTIHRTSPDGSRIVYRADQDVDDVFELYSVPFGGGPSVKISGPLVDGGDVDFLYEIVPDSSRVVYFADQDTDDVMELYSVPIDGGAPPVKLNGDLVAGGSLNTFDFEISPDGSRVVYLADQDVDDSEEVFSRRIDGSGMPVKLNGPMLIDDGDVMDFVISPDSSTVVYRAEQDIEFTEELYSRPIDGSHTAQKLNGRSFGVVTLSFCMK